MLKSSDLTAVTNFVLRCSRFVVMVQTVITIISIVLIIVVVIVVVHLTSSSAPFHVKTHELSEALYIRFGWKVFLTYFRTSVDLLTELRQITGHLVKLQDGL